MRYAKAVLLGAFCALLLAGCSGKGEANVQSTGKVSSPESPVTEDAGEPERPPETTQSQKTVQGSETTFPEMSQTAGLEEHSDGEQERFERVETKDYIFEFPAGWQGKYRIEDKDGTPPYVLVQQKASYEKMGDGLLFGIAAYRDGSYVNLPDYHIWAYDKETVYVMSEPTDVCFYTEDEAVRAEYSDMAASIEAIRKTFRVKEGNAGYDGDQYIFPNSSYIYLKEEDLWNLTQESLRIAKNEIFARHGYQFRTQELAEYFSKRDWYEGKIPAGEFDSGVFNEFEAANVSLIAKYEEQKKTQ